MPEPTTTPVMCIRIHTLDPDLDVFTYVQSGPPAVQTCLQTAYGKFATSYV